MIHRRFDIRRRIRERGKRTDKILTSLSVQFERVVYRVQYYGWYPYQADYHNQQSMGGALCENSVN